MSQQLLDDPSILDDDNIWRRIHPKQIIIDNDGVRRPSSSAFEDSSNGTPMSAIWEKLHRELGLNEFDALKERGTFSLVSFKAKLARQLGQGIQRDPIDDAPAHVLVFGPKTQSVRRQLASGSEWVVQNTDQSVQ